MKKIAILSGKFSIGLTSHLEAFYELILTTGYKPFIIINNEYRDYIMHYENIINIEDIGKLNIDCLIIFNISYNDNSVIKTLKKYNKNMKVIFIYHEPWRGFVNEFKRQKILKNFIKTCGRKILANRILQCADEVWLPSNNAKNEYLKKDSKYNNNYYVFPLIFKDELLNKLDINRKKFFSYIATVEPSKRFKAFISFIKIAHNIDPDLRFLIATKSDISKYLDSDIRSMIENKVLVINHNHNLTNYEINKAYDESWCVWLLYQSATQSGVLCKSFMYGTPVIASNIIAFKEFLNNTNSVIIKDYNNVEEIINGIQYIRENINDFSESARKEFLNKFFYKSKQQIFKSRIKYLLEKE